MAVERLLGTANLLAVDSSGAIAPDNRMLGYNWRTTAANKQVVGIYVKMPPAATEFAAGTRVQLWKRASPIANSTIELDILIGGGIVTGTAGSEQLVPGSSGYALIQNDFYFVTIFLPFDHGGNYWFKSEGSNPGSGTISGNCIFRNTISSTSNPHLLPPDDETFTNGRFGVDVAIDDVSTDISATLTITLPPTGSSLAVEPPVDATLSLVLPSPGLTLSVFESVLYDNLRQYIWAKLVADSTLAGYGITGNSLFGTNAPDSPAAELQRWAILHWSIEDPPIGRDTTSRRRSLVVWAYDRQTDYTYVDLILKRCGEVLLPIVGKQYAIDGWITQIDPGITSEDLFDPAYNAVSRSWALTIIASGL